MKKVKLVVCKHAPSEVLQLMLEIEHGGWKKEKKKILLVLLKYKMNF